MSVSMDNILDKVLEFEQGNLGDEEFLEFFQFLVDTGMAWQLQGMYGRTARNLIDAGLITEGKN